MLYFNGIDARQVGQILWRVEELRDQLPPGCNASPVHIADGNTLVRLQQRGQRLQILFGIEKGVGIDNDAITEFDQGVEDEVIAGRLADPPEVDGQVGFEQGMDNIVSGTPVRDVEQERRLI